MIFFTEFQPVAFIHFHGSSFLGQITEFRNGMTVVYYKALRTIWVVCTARQIFQEKSFLLYPRCGISSLLSLTSAVGGGHSQIIRRPEKQKEKKDVCAMSPCWERYAYGVVAFNSTIPTNQWHYFNIRHRPQRLLLIRRWGRTLMGETFFYLLLTLVVVVLVVVVVVLCFYM